LSLWTSHSGWKSSTSSPYHNNKHVAIFPITYKDNLKLTKLTTWKPAATHKLTQKQTNKFTTSSIIVFIQLPLSQTIWAVHTQQYLHQFELKAHQQFYHSSPHQPKLDLKTNANPLYSQSWSTKTKPNSHLTNFTKTKLLTN